MRGGGRFLSILSKYGSPDWELVGIDFDEEAVERSRRRGFRAEAKRIEDFKPDETFDVVIMFQLIEHVDDPATVVSQVRKVLNPGGLLIIETPNPAGLDYHCFRNAYWAHYHFPRHWNLFTTNNLKKLLINGGFSVSSSSSLLVPGSWIISLHNYFLDKKYPAALVKCFSLKNPFLLGLFVILDLTIKTAGFPTSNQRIIGRVNP